MKQGDVSKKASLLFIWATTIDLVLGLSENWNLESGWTKESPAGIGKLNALDVICGKDQMTVRAEFNGPFQGIIFSKGTYGQENCIYLKPYSGATHATFKVKYDECGTKPDLQGKYYENTIVIQYGTDIIEAWDEAKRLRCEWFEAYEKPATFRPAIPVADLDVVEMNFQGDDIDCWMEIQEGKGPWGREVSRIVPVGQPMTIVIAINDYYGQFDMRVKSCFAHDGVKPPIHLTDEFGCVLRPKMLTPFNKVRDSNGRATIISYSHFYAFKFPDSMNVQIQCTVEVCRHGCPDACQKGNYPVPHREIQSKANLGTQTKPKYSSRPDDDRAVIQNLDEPETKPYAPPHTAEDDLINQPSQIEANHEFDIRRLPTISHSANNTEIQTDTKNHMDSEDHVVPEDRNPIIKVLEMETPEEKKPTNVENPAANISPEDIKHASKFLSDLGLTNLNNFATNFMDKVQQKDIAQLLRNDKLKELAIASGLKMKGESVPQPLSLIGLTNANADNTGLRLEDVKRDKELNEAAAQMASSDPLRGRPSNNETNNEFVKPPFDGFTRHTQSGIALDAIKHNLVRPVGIQSRPHNDIVLNPTVQVMNVPLQLGIPPMQLLHSNSFIQHPQPKPQRPGFFSAFHLPKLNIPFLKNELLLRQASTIDQRNSINIPHRLSEDQHTSVPFPHGPRSLRLKRSKTGPEVSVTKQFQVVTSIDLSFAPNVTTDIPEVFAGRREEIVNGVCMPLTGFVIGLSSVVGIVMCALSFSASMMFKIMSTRKKMAPYK